MNRRIVLRLSAITALGLALLAGNAVAQQKTAKEQLTGTWMLVSVIQTNKDGTKSNRFGENPKGMIIFGADGRYSWLITRSDIPKFAVNNVNKGTAEENRAVVQGIVADIGTWSVDEATKTFTTNVEAGSFPNVNGVSRKRVYTSLTANELRYTNSDSIAGTIVEGVWKRVN